MEKNGKKHVPLAFVTQNLSPSFPLSEQVPPSENLNVSRFFAVWHAAADGSTGGYAETLESPCLVQFIGLLDIDLGTFLFALILR